MPSPDPSSATPPRGDLTEVRLSSSVMRARVVANAARYQHFLDCDLSGFNGLASLINYKQHRNIFSSAGLQYVSATTTPPAATKVGPTQAPMRVEQAADGSALLVQRGADASGLDVRIAFALTNRQIDQTITLSSDRDLDGFDTFWSSQLNQVQCTSLFLQGVLQGTSEPQWLEVSTPGMGNDGRIYYRPFDPHGKTWLDHLRDNPLVRQKPAADPASIRATLAAGFHANEPNKCPFTGFYYGLVDDYVFLMIFREPEFYVWTGCSGATLRNPSWDYGLAGGPLKAGEARTFHVRLVYKPFDGVDDVLAEVRSFRGERANDLCGRSAPR